MPGYPKRDAVRRDLDRVAERPPEHVDVVDRVLDHGAAAGVGDVLAPRRSVEALDRKILVVAHHRRERRPVFTRSNRHRDVPEHGSPAQDQANLMRNPLEGGTDADGRCEIGRQRLLAEDRQTTVGRRLDRGEVGGRPGAHPDDVDLVEQRLEALLRLTALVARHLGGAGRDRRRRLPSDGPR